MLLKKYYKTYCLVILFCISLNTYGKKLEYDGPCNSKENDNNLEECLDKELAVYDKELNRIYKGFLKNKRLNKSEKLWIKFKDTDCNYIAYEVNGGLEYSLIYKACLINKTKNRIVELKRPLFYYGWFVDHRK